MRGKEGMHGIIDEFTTIVSLNAPYRSAKLSLNKFEEGGNMFKDLRFAFHRESPGKMTVVV